MPHEERDKVLSKRYLEIYKSFNESVVVNNDQILSPAMERAASFRNFDGINTSQCLLFQIVVLLLEVQLPPKQLRQTDLLFSL